MRLSTLLPAAVLTVVMSACEPEELVRSTTGTNIVVEGDFQLLAACSLPKIEASQGKGIKKLDQEHGVLLALGSGEVRLWELTFTPAPQARTQVVFVPVQQLWGSQSTDTERVMSDVRSCSSEGRSEAQLSSY